MLKFALVVSLSMPPMQVAAQDAPRDTARLAEMVVTATRLPMPAVNVASSVTVISGAQLRAQGITTVADALRSVPGAAVARSGSFGAATSLFLRGGESDYVHVLVDGVPVNGPGGAFNFASLSSDNIERIEIVAGPASVLYGSDAVAGVVQIFTRTGRGADAIEGGVAGGTYHTLKLAAAMQGSGEYLDYTFSVSRFNTDGSYLYNNQHRNLVASSRVRVHADARSDATLTLRYTDNSFHFPTDFTGKLEDHNQFTFGDGTAVGVDAGRRVSNRVEVRVLLASHETDDGADDQPDTPADTLGFYASSSLTHGRRRSVDGRINIQLGKPGIVTVGAKVETQSFEALSESKSQFGLYSSSSRSGRSNWAAYVQALLEPVSRLSVTLGARMDDNDKFGQHATYRAGASFRPAVGTKVRGTVGTGFKEATFVESSSTPNGGNPNLKPERSFSWDAGLEQTLHGRVAATVTVFSQRFRDMIQYNPTPVGVAPNYENIAAANADGVETTAGVTLPHGVDFHAAYTYLHTWATNTGYDTGFDATFVRDSALLRRPMHSVAVTANLGGRRGSASVSTRYVGKRADRNFALFPAPRVTLPAYAVVDVAGELVVRAAEPRVTVNLRVENALDRAYAEILNYPAPGRAVLVGGRVAF
ncbi:MAG: TonB-dependent receptor [Gemmatimonadetes bacterium]|nr:TonB-dependent receptor [Gemmatimonadota bacterium]